MERKKEKNLIGEKLSEALWFRQFNEEVFQEMTGTKLPLREE